MLKKTLTRRDFIKAGASLGFSVLAACARQSFIPAHGQTPMVTGTTVVTETIVANQVTTATSAPTQPPGPVKFEVWWNANLPRPLLAMIWNPSSNPASTSTWQNT